MIKRKRLYYALIFLTAINFLFFIFREHSHYRKYSTYEELYGDCGRNCQAKWSSFLTPYPLDERNDAIEILRGDSLFNIAKSELEKTIAIGRLIYTRFSAQLGTSSQSQTASPLSVFRNLDMCNKCGLWCGDFARMFNFFSLSAGMTSRYVQIKNEVDNDDHVVNEVYLQEQKRWVLVDLTYNMLLVTQGSLPLDLLTFREKLATNTGLKKWQAIGPEVMSSEVSLNAVGKKYYAKSNILYFFHYIDLGEAYSFDNKLKRYIFPGYWYEIYAEKRGNNIWYYIKFICLISWFALAMFFIKLLFNDRNKQFKKGLRWQDRS